MLERRFSEILLVIGGCVVAALWGKNIAGGGVLVAILPVMVLVAATLSFRYQRYLPAIAFGAIWYVGGSPFLRELPYAFYAMAAAFGVAGLDFFFRRTPDKALIKFVAPSGMISLFCLAGIIGVYLSVTLLKHLGVLPAFQYGAAGGLKVGMKFLILLSFLVALFYGNVSTSKLHCIPFIALLIGVFALAIDTMNFVNPQTAFITYYITTGINFEVLDYLRGSSDSVLRLGALRFFGFFMVLFSIHKYIRSLRSDGHTGKGHVAVKYLIIIGIGGIIILFGGFRNFLVRYVVVLFAFFYTYDRKWMFGLVLSAMVLWGGAVIMGSSIEALPLAGQRILGTLPGVHQTAVSLEAMGGFDMRSQLRMRFFDSEFWKHPWFGRGQIGEFFVVPESAYADHLLFFEVTQLWHSGLASTLDVVGVVGAVMLVVAQILTLFYSIHLLRNYSSRLAGWMVWCVLFFYAYNIIFWYNGFFHREFPMMAMSIAGVYLVGAVLKKEDRASKLDAADDESLKVNA